ncbi:MAG: hypothetical protein IJ609_01600, partial [Paludibacteraceae bacterium]|nr:hypothetical protein [Paludibacteraceae bacterium]
RKTTFTRFRFFFGGHAEQVRSAQAWHANATCCRTTKEVNFSLKARMLKAESACFNTPNYLPFGHLPFTI